MPRAFCHLCLGWSISRKEVRCPFLISALFTTFPLPSLPRTGRTDPQGSGTWTGAKACREWGWKTGQRTSRSWRGQGGPVAGLPGPEEDPGTIGTATKWDGIMGSEFSLCLPTYSQLPLFAHLALFSRVPLWRLPADSSFRSKLRSHFPNP